MCALIARFCDLCVILFFGMVVVFGEDKVSLSTTDDTSSGNCSCGGFASVTPQADTAPILSQKPGLVVKCDDVGQTTCKNLCNALATATKAKGPEILCNKLKEAFELKLSAYYKICDHPWKYADITAEEPLCCVEGKVKICPSVEKQNATKADVIDAKTVM